MTHLEHDYTVLMHLLPSLVNGIDSDRDVLTDDEYDQLEKFMSEHGEHWYPLQCDEYEDLIQYMSKCDVTGLIGWCVEIKAA